MLVLSRGRNETVIVGDDVKVTLLDILFDEAAVRSAKVSLGFQAPKDVPIQRKELLHRMNMKASGSGSSSPHRPKSDIAGKIQPVRGAAVRIQIQAPPETSIHCSRASENASGHRQIVLPCRSESISADQNDANAPSPTQVFNCQHEDNILIGNHVLITIVDVFRFVANS